MPLRRDLKPVCKDSEIVLLDQHRLYLTSLLADHGNTTTLLYRGSRDGWTASDFHRLCDGKGPTVVLYYTSKDRVCGSFTSVSWQSEGGNKEDHEAFLFSLDK